MDADAIAHHVDAALADPETYRWILSNRASTKHRYVAFMVAKAGCSTIKLALHEFETPEIKLAKWSDVHKAPENSKLVDYSRADILEMLTSDDWFRFCLVRNPFDRLASAWKQKLVSDEDPGYEWLRQAVRTREDIGATDPISFRACVEFLLSENTSMARDVHWIDQVTVTRPDVVAHDFIGRFENFSADLSTILTRAGAPPDVVAISSVVTNATESVPLRQLYDEELAARVHAHFAADFAAFGYEADSWRSPSEPFARRPSRG